MTGDGSTGSAPTDEETAVESLTRFGLTAYEARVFVALQRLGTGTASEISEVSEVPRSQVYGAAEGLEERGLVEVQQSSPTRYRPVGLEEARTRLYREFREDGERAFDYLERVEGSHRDSDPRTESVWTVEGSDAIADRVADLLAEADTRAVYATGDPARLESRVLDAIEERVDAGVEVVGLSENEAVYDRLAAIDGVTAHQVPSELTPAISTGRMLVADRDTFLLSMVETEYLPDASQETAIWGAETGFARVLVALLGEYLQNTFGVAD